jgi:hypothetical protein
MIHLKGGVRNEESIGCRRRVRQILEAVDSKQGRRTTDNTECFGHGTVVLRTISIKVVSVYLKISLKL